MTKILGIDPIVRNKILRLHLDRCRLSHFIAFQEWRREVLGELVGAHKLVVKRQSIASIDKKLFNGTDDIFGMLDGVDSPKKAAANAHALEHSRGSGLHREKKTAAARNPDLM